MTTNQYSILAGDWGASLLWCGPVGSWKAMQTPLLHCPMQKHNPWKNVPTYTAWYKRTYGLAWKLESAKSDRFRTNIKTYHLRRFWSWAPNFERPEWCQLANLYLNLDILDPTSSSSLNQCIFADLQLWEISIAEIFLGVSHNGRNAWHLP